MLRDRRNCLRGRIKGLDDFLLWLEMGEPLRDEQTPEATKPGRERGAANAGTAARGVGLSWVGELSKISESDSEEDVAGLLEKFPLPKRKGGSSLSRLFCRGITPVLKHLAFVNVGRSRPLFRLS